MAKLRIPRIYLGAGGTKGHECEADACACVCVCRCVCVCVHVSVCVHWCLWESVYMMGEIMLHMWTDLYVSLWEVKYCNTMAILTLLHIYNEKHFELKMVHIHKLYWICLDVPSPSPYLPPIFHHPFNHLSLPALALGPHNTQRASNRHRNGQLIIEL